MTGLRKLLTGEVELKGLLKLAVVSEGKTGADAEQVTISGEAGAGKDAGRQAGEEGLKMRDD